MAQSGDTVQVHYTGTLADGTVFDSSEGGDPLEFKLGTHQMIPGFEDAIYGMAEGETKTFTIPAAEAYGERRSELVITVDFSELPPDAADLEVGDVVNLSTSTGGSVRAIVTEVTEKTVTFDANHFLAGKDLTFEVRLVKIIR